MLFLCAFFELQESLISNLVLIWTISKRLKLNHLRQLLAYAMEPSLLEVKDEKGLPTALLSPILGDGPVTSSVPFLEKYIFVDVSRSWFHLLVTTTQKVFLKSFETFQKSWKDDLWKFLLKILLIMLSTSPRSFFKHLLMYLRNILENLTAWTVKVFSWCFWESFYQLRENSSSAKVIVAGFAFGTMIEGKRFVFIAAIFTWHFANHIFSFFKQKKQKHLEPIDISASKKISVFFRSSETNWN